MCKRKTFLFITVFLIALFALPVAAHAGWITAEFERQTAGKYTIWRETNSELCILNNETGKLKTITGDYTSFGVTDGKTLYYGTCTGKHGGYTIYHKCILDTDKTTFIIRLKDGPVYEGNTLVAYRNGYLYINSFKPTGYKKGYYVFRRINIATKKISIVKKHFVGREWNGKHLIKGYDDSGKTWKKATIKI